MLHLKLNFVNFLNNYASDSVPLIEKTMLSERIWSYAFLKSCYLMWVNLFLDPLFCPLVYLSMANSLALWGFPESCTVLSSGRRFGRVRPVASNLRLPVALLGSLWFCMNFTVRKLMYSDPRDLNDIALNLTVSLEGLMYIEFSGLWKRHHSIDLGVLKSLASTFCKLQCRSFAHALVDFF